MSDLRSLIEAAKADAPSAAVRTKVWTGVAGAIGTGAGIGGAVAGSASAVKMLALGSLLGGALTVGIAGAMLFAGPPPRLPGARTETAAKAPNPALTWPSAPIQPSGGSVGAAFNSNPAANAAKSVDSRPISGSGARRAAVALPVKAAEEHTPSAPVRHPDGALAREASLLAAARSALAEKDATSALQMVRKLRTLPAGQLVPEELAVEAQALRALGQNDDADQVEATLRARFPDSVLGR